MSACTPVEQGYDEHYGAGFANVDEALWLFEHATPYPFTIAYGEISCTFHPRFGREVYFMPKGFTDESYIGTPLNKSASESLKQSGMRPNVPYNIKKDANLDAAIQIGLQVCDEQMDSLENNI